MNRGPRSLEMHRRRLFSLVEVDNLTDQIVGRPVFLSQHATPGNCLIATIASSRMKQK